MARNLMREFLRKGPLGSTVMSHRWPCLVSPVALTFMTSQRQIHLASDLCANLGSSAPKKISEDRIEMFINADVQALLKRLSGKDYQRVFRKRKIGQKLAEPKYTFMTEEQLQKSLEDADHKAEKLLQMPPVLRPRKPIDKILSFDPEIQGLEKSSIIFTDITLNISNEDRLIVARDPDGTLRYASWEEREKMNMIYFPKPGREFNTPKMFAEPEILKQVLDRASIEDNTYEFVLDRACLQFEPNDPLYISVSETTYDMLDEKRHYDLLKSTRHYGPLVFYLARTRKMDNLLLCTIENERVSSDATALVSLFHVLFPESKSQKVAQGLKKDVEKVRAYIELDAIKRSELELTLNAYEEIQRQHEELEEGLQKSHGIQNS